MVEYSPKLFKNLLETNCGIFSVIGNKAANTINRELNSAAQDFIFIHVLVDSTKIRIYEYILSMLYNYLDDSFLNSRYLSDAKQAHLMNLKEILAKAFDASMSRIADPDLYLDSAYTRMNTIAVSQNAPEQVKSSLLSFKDFLKETGEDKKIIVHIELANIDMLSEDIYRDIERILINNLIFIVSIPSIPKYANLKACSQAGYFYLERYCHPNQIMYIGERKN